MNTTILSFWLLAIVVGTLIGKKKGRIGSGIIWSFLFGWLGVLVVLCLEDISGTQCKYCGARIKEGYTFCQKCGKENK